jgi:hypothetical protein
MAEDDRIEPTDEGLPVATSPDDDTTGQLKKRRPGTGDEEPEDDAQGHASRPPTPPLEPLP